MALAALLLPCVSPAQASRPAPAAAAAERPAIGTRVGTMRFVDTRAVPRQLADYGAHKATVLCFVGKDCPIARRYLPRLATLEARYRERGVLFLAVNSSRGDSLLDMATQQVEQDVAFPFVRDFDGAAARAAGATRLGEVVVLDAERAIRFRGRVDEQHRFGGSAPTEGRRFLAEALDAVLAGADVPTAETEVEGCRIEPPAARDGGAPPTFHADVEPLLQKHCQPCHHKGGQAPFALVTFADAADRAEMIGEVVREQRMPPWYASPGHRYPFQNHIGLPPEGIDVVQRWVAGGAPRGDSAAAPPPRAFAPATWRIGEPDLVLKATPVRVPADGKVPYQYLFIPHVFKEDTWLQAIEIRPEQPGVLHHANLVCIEQGGRYRPEGFVTGIVPGGDPMALDDGIAFLVPKNHVFVIQAHYVSNGTDVEDRLSVGLRFPRAPVVKRLRHFQIHDNRFVIPPGAAAYRVAAARVLPGDATGVGMFCHMHLRGRDMTFTATDPQGERSLLLRVPNYNFEWQQSYHWVPGVARFSKGTRIDVVAHFDNSRSNPFNPAPDREVRFGLETEDEMMYGFFFFTLDGERLDMRIDPATGRVADDPARGSGADSRPANGDSGTAPRSGSGGR